MDLLISVFPLDDCVDETVSRNRREILSWREASAKLMREPRERVSGMARRTMRVAGHNIEQTGTLEKK